MKKFIAVFGAAITLFGGFNLLGFLLPSSSISIEYRTNDANVKLELSKCRVFNPSAFTCSGLPGVCPPSTSWDRNCVAKLKAKYPGKIAP